MNGARTTFMRRGYLLTALAAAVLLAASTGTASAQVTVEVPRSVNEGDRATINVVVDVQVAAGTAAGSTITVTPSAVAAPGSRVIFPATAAELAADSVGFAPPAATGLVLNVPANPLAAAQGGTPMTRTLTGSITWITGVDVDAEDEVLQLDFALVASDTANVTFADGTVVAAADPAVVTIDDRETQDFVWRVTTRRPVEGSPITATLTAVPEPTAQNTYNVGLAVDTPGYTIPTASQTAALTNGTATASITVNTPPSDRNRVSDTITLTAVMQGTTTSVAAPLPIEVADLHALPAGDNITAKAYAVDAMGAKTADEAMSLVEGGAPVHVTVTIDRGVTGYPSGEALDVALVAADSSQVGDYSVTPSEVTVPVGSGMRNSSMDFELRALADDDIGDETLAFNLVTTGANSRMNGPGESIGSFSIGVVDATDPMIWAKDGAYDAIMMALGDAPLNPGDSVEIGTDDVFGLAQGYTASYGASVEGDAVSASASGAMVTVTASKAGEAKVTITGTAKTASSSLIITQTVSNIAEVTFPVMVEDMPLEVTLHQPDGVMDGNIVEGKSYDIKVTANREVTEDEGEVEVTIMRDRAASDADDDDFTVSSATIMAGYDSATAELMVTEDMEDDAGHAMGEVLVLYGESDGAEVEGELTFTIWDEAVPALPLIAQLLLALFLMAGGARLYRRRQG